MNTKIAMLNLMSPSWNRNASLMTGLPLMLSFLDIASSVICITSRSSRWYLKKV